MTGENYTLRITTKDLQDRCNALRGQLAKAVTAKYGRRIKRIGLQVGIDMLLQLWDSLPSESQLEIIDNFKTCVVGYPFSTRKNPGQWTKQS